MGRGRTGKEDRLQLDILEIRLARDGKLAKHVKHLLRRGPQLAPALALEPHNSNLAPCTGLGVAVDLPPCPLLDGD